MSPGGYNGWLARILKSCGPTTVTTGGWFPIATSKSRIGAGVFLLYVLLVRLTRWRKYEAIHRKYAHKIGCLTPEEAQEIILVSSSWDMPNLSGYALAFALFKTYAIVSDIVLTRPALWDSGADYEDGSADDIKYTGEVEGADVCRYRVEALPGCEYFDIFLLRYTT